MPKALRILCLVLLLAGCGRQSEVTAAATHYVPEEKSNLPTTTTTTTSTTTTTIPTTTTTLLPTTTTVEFTSGTVQAAATSANGSWPWDPIAECESGNGSPGSADWGSTTNGYYEGGLQFDPGTWKAYVADGRTYGLSGYPSHAYDASREQQITVAIRVRDGVEGSSDPYLNPQGYGAWPRCRHAAGV